MNSVNPPKLALRFLRLICPDQLQEEIEGDLRQRHARDVERYGERVALLRMIWNTIRFCRPGIVFRRRSPHRTGFMPLMRNYFSISVRHLIKNKTTFTFKLGGLVVALFSLLVIILYVQFQRSFDKFHEDYNNIYRVNSSWIENGSRAQYAFVPPGIGPGLKATFPEIRSFARIGFAGSYQIRAGGKSIKAHGFVNADSTIFDVLTLNVLRGDRHCLKDRSKIMITESMAREIFGDEDPMYKEITFIDRSDATFEVSAIISDLPPNTHLYLRALLSMNGLTDNIDGEVDPWTIGIDGSGPLYIRLKESTDPAEFESKAQAFVSKNIKSETGGLDKDYKISLQPIQDIYLAPGLYAEFCRKGNILYVYAFTLLGIFLLTIASINYVNLSIVDFHKRIREIGVRKILGAKRTQIVFQVVCETVIVCFAALVISIALLYLIFPQINQTIEKDLSFSMVFDRSVMIALLLIFAGLIFLSTAYPAYKLSATEGIDDIKARLRMNGSMSVGKVLLVIQFTIAVITIVATYTVREQLQFIQVRNPGYDKVNTIALFMPDRYPDKLIPVIKQELATVPGVEYVSYSTFLIVGGYYRDWYRVETETGMKQMMLNEVFFDYDFLKTMDIPLVAGRDFDPDNNSDPHSAFIVNEAAVREFQWEDPIGKRIAYGYDEGSGEKWEGTVVGVTKDFNIYSLHRKIEPLVMRLPWSSWPGQSVHIKIRGPLEPTIAQLKKKYETIMPGFLMDYHIISELYDNQYAAERKVFLSLKLCTGVILLVSVLGIVSLSAYLSLQRMKEFGIRKVLGATAFEITRLHMRSFLKIAVLSNLIALPFVYYLMHTWLQNFAYRITLSQFAFLGFSALSIVIVLFSTVGSSWRAATLNPVDVIKMD